MNKPDHEKIIDALENFPLCKKTFLDFSEYVTDDLKKIFSDSVKNWYSFPGGVVWGVFVYIWYNFIHQIRGFSFNFVDQINGEQNFLIYVMIFASIIIIISQIYIVAHNNTPYDVKKIMSSILAFAVDANKYGLEDQVAEQTLREDITSHKLNILQKYDSKISSMNGKKEKIVYAQFACLAAVAICSSFVVTRMDMISACYPKTMDELISDKDRKKCLMEIDAWKLRKTPAKIPSRSSQ